MLEWLLTSIDPMRPHDVGFEISWHARLMVFGWSVLIPIGIFSARFFKVMPKQDWPRELDNQIWWRAHLIFQYLAGFLMLVALYIIWGVSGSHEGAFLHRLMGWSTVILCGVQFLAGWFRGSKGGPTEIENTGTVRGDHFDMTSRRKAFEYIHKFVGYICLSASLLTVFTGLWMVNAPNWMWICLACWWLVIIVAFIKCQQILGAIDTYQAIWGPDTNLPGNKLKPIGLGVHRRKSDSELGQKSDH